MEHNAAQIGIRSEIIYGTPIWEASPVIRHQRIVDRIRAGIMATQQEGNGCGCTQYADMYILIVDPPTNRVNHYHDGRSDENSSPVDCTFACVCRVSIWLDRIT